MFERVEGNFFSTEEVVGGMGLELSVQFLVQFFDFFILVQYFGLKIIKISLEDINEGKFLKTTSCLCLCQCTALYRKSCFHPLSLKEKKFTSIAISKKC